MQYSAWSVRSNSSPLTAAIEALARLESSSKVLWASNLNFVSAASTYVPLFWKHRAGKHCPVKRPTVCRRPAAERRRSGRIGSSAVERPCRPSSQIRPHGGAGLSQFPRLPDPTINRGAIFFRPGGF
jgi:hypothetical protein